MSAPPAFPAPAGAAAVDPAAAAPHEEPVVRVASKEEQDFKARSLAAAASHVEEELDKDQVGAGVPLASTRVAARLRSPWLRHRLALALQ